ncbi:MAG: hypothetical protein Q9N34_09190 [Aquificota bacterium]|nr:hypothetical protein [Aquificota bacterium]
MGKDKLLTVKEVLERLRQNGVNISEPTLRRYVYKSFIPDGFVVKTRHGFVYRYKFKPEVVDYLTKELKDRT